MVITGDRVRRERGRLRMTQRELAAALGVGLKTITDWEAGVRPIPLTRYAAVTAVLGIDETEPEPANPLAAVSDLDLVAELMRRLATRTVDTNKSQDGNAGSLGEHPSRQKGSNTHTALSGDMGDVRFDDGVVGSLEHVQRNPGSASRRHKGAAS